jgi:hypothetical protein
MILKNKGTIYTSNQHQLLPRTKSLQQIRSNTYLDLIFKVESFTLTT